MNRKKSSLLIICSLIIVLLLAVSPAIAAAGPFTYYWHAFLGGTSADQAKAVEVDSAGSVIVAGTSWDAWTGPAAQAPLNAFNSDQEITVTKISKAGAYLWHTFHGTGGTDRVYAMAVNPDGKILVTGFSQFEWKGPGNIDPRHAHSGSYDIFVLCLNADGTYAWHTFYGANTNFNEIGLAAAWDRNNEPLIAGVSDNSWTGAAAAAPLHSHSGSDDIFVLKLGADGAYQWHTFYGSANQDIAWGVTTDSNNNIYLTGSSYISWNGPLAESPLNAFTANPLDQKDDLLVMRLSPTGAYAWHAFYGSTDQDRGNEIVTDAANNLYIAGESDAPWDFPFGPTPPLHAHSGGKEMLVMKLVPGATSLTYGWHTFYGSDLFDTAQDLALGPYGLVVGGYSQKAWSWGGTPPVFPHSGSEDLAGLGLSTTGGYQWHTFFGSSSMDEANGVAADANGNVILAGWSDASWTGPGSFAPKIPHAGDQDMVVVKMNMFKTWAINTTGTQDGWILESGETTNAGGTINTVATTLRLGDDAARKQYRSLLSFATGAVLPDNAVITKVTLKVRRQTVVGGGDPVATFQGFYLDIRKGTFGTAALQTTDWQAAAQKTIGPFRPALASGWYEFNLTGVRAYINKLATSGGLTQVRLRFKLDDNNNTTANYLSLFSGNAAAAARPQLLVEYYVP